MSIIYDALQKTQRNREYLRIQNALIQKKPHRRNLKWIVMGGLILMVGGGAGGLFSFYGLPPSSIVKLMPREAQRPAHFWVTDSRKTTTAPHSVPVANPATTVPVVGQTVAASVVEPAPVLLTPQPAVVKPVLLQELKPMLSNKLTLNGVLISGKDKIALINNQSFHLGDMIEGMKIVAIEFNLVKLQNGSRFTELRV